MAQNEEAGLTSTQYIKHHLTHYSSGDQKSLVDFSVINLDTLFWGFSLGMLGIFLLWVAARKATSGVPGRAQAFVEMLVELVDSQASSIIHGDRRFIAPVALTVFVWVVLMNSMDFLPVDLFTELFAAVGIPIHEHRVVPTADLNGTLGISLGVLALCLFYSFKIKGTKGFLGELFSAPFGSHPLLWIPNLLMNIVEFIAKTMSLAMRLFGNMFAGELIFLLIALLGAQATWWGMGMQVVAGSFWAIFHILIVLLQAFIFMMLTLVYIGQAHDKH